MGRELGRQCPLWGEAGCPSKTTWSGILIHPTVWPQYTNVTDRQRDRQPETGQDRTELTGQWSDSIGRTVLETVALLESLGFLPRDANASTVYAVVLCLSVCLSMCPSFISEDYCVTVSMLCITIKINTKHYYFIHHNKTFVCSLFIYMCIYFIFLYNLQRFDCLFLK